MLRGGIILPEHLSPRILRDVSTSPPGQLGVRENARAQTLAETERQKILETLARCNGNRTRAAELLGIGRRTLIYKLKSYADGEDC